VIVMLQIPQISSEARGHEPVGQQAPKYLLGYEDQITGLRARQILCQLTGDRDAASSPEMQGFRFELLSLRGIRELMASDGLSAHVLIVSAHSVESLPEQVKAWITYWLGRRVGRPCSVVVSFDACLPNPAPDHPTLSYFRSLVLWSEVRLAVLFGEGAHEQPNQASWNLSEGDAQRPARLWAPALVVSGYRHGGLNE